MDNNEVVHQEKSGEFSLYWAYYKPKNVIMSFAREHKKLFALLFLLVMSFAFVFRWVIQPYAVTLRVYSFEIVLVTGLLYGFWGAMKSRFRRFAYVIALVVSTLIIWPHEYFSLCYRFNNLNKQETDLLESVHERIQPLNSVRDSIGRQFNNGNYQYNEPYYVRGANGDYRWTSSREPVNGIWSYVGEVDEVVNVSATDPDPDYSRVTNHIPVHFAVGDHLHLGKDGRICAIRSLGLIGFFSCEPDKVRNVEEKPGQFVQIVPFTRYAGFFYPQKEPGGVLIIRQTKGGLYHFIHMALFGDGEYVAPEDIGKYPFLKGQNLVPYQVSRYIAESFSFRYGIDQNLPWSNNGAIRIPDLPGDANDQPFAVCFKQDNGEEKIFQYFGLEPSMENMGGQTLSLWVPGDGIGPVLVYDNIKNQDTMIGVSSVGGNVKTVDEHIDWTHTQPAEHKPWIHKIMGKKRFLYMSTLVTNQKNISAILTNGKEDSGESHQAGGVPKIVLTEPHLQKSIRVDSTHPEMWEKEVETAFGPYWKQTDSK